MASNPLRIALVADIHANVWALEAVLADIKKQRVDTIFDLGDILYGPLKPRATYERLQAIRTARSMMPPSRDGVRIPRWTT
jgi:predicted phosphodiesterase